MTKVYLGMILKNEESGIEETLRSILPNVDGAIIEDTGSEDNTKDIVRRVCNEYDKPLILFDEPWQDFSYNRNTLMDRAHIEYGDQGYLLQIDSDWILQFSRDWKDKLKEDVHGVDMKSGDSHWMLAKITKLDTKCRYVGKVHEYLSTETTYENPGVLVHVIKYSSERHPKDLELLAGETDSRSVFYRAQTHFALENIDESIEDYKLRASLNEGFFEEQFYSYFRLGEIFENKKQDNFQALRYYWKAFKFDPKRNEPLLALCSLFRKLEMFEMAEVAADKAVANKKNIRILFVDISALGWRRNYEAAMSYWYVGRKEEATQLWMEMRVDPKCPIEYRKNAKYNIEKYGVVQ